MHERNKHGTSRASTSISTVSADVRHRRHRANGTAVRLLYSVEEAADLLGIGRTFMFHLVATGEIDSFKIGKRRKIPHGALDDYIQRLRHEQSGASRATDYE